MPKLKILKGVDRKSPTQLTKGEKGEPSSSTYFGGMGERVTSFLRVAMNVGSREHEGRAGPKSSEKKLFLR